MYGLILIDYDEDYDEDFDYWGDDDVEDLENFDEEYFVSEKVFFLLVGKDEDYFLNLGYQFEDMILFCIYCGVFCR